MNNKPNHDQFEINGFFYKKDKHTFRKFLEIRKKGCKKINPDLMVIMMNPGSSHPKGINKGEEIPGKLLNKEVPTEPDNTQDQIMKVMNECKFEYARILNLSDLRDAKSSSFYSKLKDLNSDKISHSIFQESRNLEFEELFNRKAKLIVAWGVNKALKDLAEKALSNLDKKGIGWNKPNINWAFYHPLPRTAQKQEDWINNIVNELKK